MAKKASKNINEENNTEVTCIHCGEKVSSSEKICPHCGLSVSDSNTDNISLLTDDNTTTKVDNKKKGISSTALVFIGIGVLVLAAIFIAWWLTSGKNQFIPKQEVEESQLVKEDIKEKFNIDITKPEKAEDLDYAIEGDDVVKVSYSKVVDEQNNIVMHFVMRIAKSTEDIEKSIGLSDSKGNDIVFPSTTPILMTVKCEDETEVPVESYVALDENGYDMKYMRSTWYDNDNYYSMVTDDLYTREEFLQEVNRVIIANHENF